jgi:enoyl-CoA hydratase/carnithine racemase
MSLPEFETLQVIPHDEAAVATVLLNRPERLNALSAQTLRDVVGVSRWLDDSDSIKVVILRGAGRAFSAGFDLNDFRELDGNRSPRDTADLGRLAAEALTNTRPLTIAAVHGHCVGGGLVLAASCDLRLASSTARFSIPEVDLGIPLAWGGIPRLVRELGPAITKELVLTCRPFGSDEALALRFLNRVVGDAELVTAAEALAVELAGKPGFALRATKTHVNAVMDEIAGVGRNANDADTLATALTDPESRAISRAYLAARNK